MNRLGLILTVSILSCGMITVPTLQAQAPAGKVLIPGGEFEMGDHYDVGYSDEKPLHDVYIDAFHMDIFEVTNEQYAAGLNWAWAQGGLITVTGGVVYKAGSGTSYPYCDTTTSSSYSRITWNGSSFGVVSGKEDHPIVRVSWYGAAAYANWRSEQDGLRPRYNLSTWECNFRSNPPNTPKGKVWLKEVTGRTQIEEKGERTFDGQAFGYRLPTEAEWEYAARGGAHDPYYKWPWNDNGLDGSKANYYNSGDPYDNGTTPAGYYDGNQTPAGSDMANGYGLYDMAGNVWEWCNDWYDPGYYGVSPYDNPRGPASGTSRVLRGGSWVFHDRNLRCANRNRNYPDNRINDGSAFRLALD